MYSAVHQICPRNLLRFPNRVVVVVVVVVAVVRYHLGISLFIYLIIYCLLKCINNHVKRVNELNE